MDVDLDLLAWLCKKGSPVIAKAVAGSGYLPATVIGVATFLLDHDGNVDLLTAKQTVTYRRFLEPLLFDVACKGADAGACRGNGRIEPELLAKAYRDDTFFCAACRQALFPADALN